MEQMIYIFLLSLSSSLMYIGANIDKQERIYPNPIVAVTTILGLGLAYFNNRFLIGLILCLAFHTLGVFDGIFMNLMKPGDWKMFATLPLYIPLENSKVFLVFGGVLIILAVYTKLKQLRKLNLENVKKSFQYEKDAIKTMLFLKEHLVSNPETLALFKEQTVPMTYLLFISFIVTQIIFLV